MNGIVGSLSVALIHSLWPGCVIALVLALAFRLIRDARVHLRYVLSVAALGLMALMPMITVAFTLNADGADVQMTAPSNAE